MWSYILKRLLLMIPTLLGILVITFVVVQFVPGGPVEQMVAQLEGRDLAGGEVGAPGGGDAAYRGRQGLDPKQIEEIKQLYGFDKPAHERFFQMLGQFARFDLGRSFYHNKDVWQKLRPRSKRANWPSIDRKSTRLNSSHSQISYAVFCLKKKRTL